MSSKHYHVVPLVHVYTGVGWYNPYVKLRYEYRGKKDAVEVAENCARLTNETWVVIDSTTWAVIHTSVHKPRLFRRRKREQVVMT